MLWVTLGRHTAIEEENTRFFGRADVFTKPRSQADRGGVVTSIPYDVRLDDVPSKRLHLGCNRASAMRRMPAYLAAWIFGGPRC